MIYRDRMITMADARHNFHVYRLIRILHDLKVINDAELIRHEELIYGTKMIGIDIDWYRFRIVMGPNDYLQF